MPGKLQERIEEAVKQEGSSDATCAIIRVEAFPAAMDEDDEFEESSGPLGCFKVLMGTDPSNVEYKVSLSPRAGRMRCHITVRN